MNRAAFYDSLRPHLNWTLENVAGTDFLLDRIEGADIQINDAAYMLATAWWETGQRMQPIDEYGGSAYFNKRYGPGTRVGKVLGNTQPGDGARFHGRGYVQLTGRRNYTLASEKFGVDFVSDPDRVKAPDHAWPIMLRGMVEGWFTGKDLDDYIDDIDEPYEEDYREYVNARRVINGTDKASTIAVLAARFEQALKDSSYGLFIPPIPDDPGVEPKPPPLDLMSILRLIANRLRAVFSWRRR